eukprot:14527_1
MSGRKMNFEQMHQFTLEHLFEEKLGKGSIFEHVDEELYKLAKEKFVSDLNGTHWIEIVSVITLLPLSYLLLNTLSHYLRISNKIILSSHTQFIIEFIILIIPTIFIHNNNNSTSLIYLLIFIHIAIIFIIITLSYSQHIKIFDLNLTALPHGCYEDKKLFVSFVRTGLMIHTIIAILSVDFTVFPRHYAKCEMYGFSLMDVGVGCFIIALGLISAVKKARHNSTYYKRNVQNFFIAFRSSMPLFVFGVLRFVLTWIVGYQTHVSEYGVHWNFFFTMFIVTFVSFFMNIKSENGLKIAMILSILYQIFLCVFGSDYVLYAERVNIISQNKEGLVSCIGYFICYMVGEYVGYCVSNDMKTKRNVLMLILKLIVVEFVIILVCYLMNSYVENVSRRLTNVGYILYALGVFLWTMILFLVPSLVLFHRNDSVLLQAVNSNQLFIFLLANMLTGVINLSFSTLFATPFVSYTIIVCYMFVICVVSYIFHLKNVKIKL